MAWGKGLSRREFPPAARRRRTSSRGRGSVWSHPPHSRRTLRYAQRCFWPGLREFEHTGTRQLDEDLAQALTGGSGEMLEQLIKVRERALAELRDG